MADYRSYDESPNMSRQRDLVLSINEFCFLQNKTNGSIKSHVGPLTMTISQQEAFKARDIEKRTAYELIKQRILVAEKSGQFELPLSDEEITNLIIKEYKERWDIMDCYAPENELHKMAAAVAKELEQYLPKQMSEDEVIAIIKRLKETESNVGKLIGLTVKEVGNRFDKSKIAALVRSI